MFCTCYIITSCGRIVKGLLKEEIEFGFREERQRKERDESLDFEIDKTTM